MFILSIQLADKKLLSTHLVHDEGNKSWIETVFFHNWGSNLDQLISSSQNPVTFTKWRLTCLITAWDYWNQAFWKSVPEGLVKQSLHWVVIFAAPLLKTWECSPRSVNLKYKTDIISFFVDIDRGSGKKVLAINIFSFLPKYGLFRKIEMFY